MLRLVESEDRFLVGRLCRRLGIGNKVSRQSLLVTAIITGSEEAK